MLHALVLKLRAEQAAELPRTHGHQAHAFFLRMVQAADPALAEQLHDPQTRKPFTVSSLQAPTRQHPNAVRVGAGAAVWLRVTLLDDALFGPFMARFLRPETPPLRLGPATLHVEEVVGTREGHTLAGYSDFSTLLSQAGADREIQLHFSSPTAFSLGQAPGGKKRMCVLPEPALVFDSLLRKWNQLAPADLALDPALRQTVEEHTVIAQHELCTAMFQFPRHLQVGFTGRCRFVTPIGDTEQLRALNALADFAMYAGVGYKTTMGMGQTWRAGKTAQPFSDRAALPAAGGRP